MLCRAVGIVVRDLTRFRAARGRASSRLLHLDRWIQENEASLAPPVCNKILFPENRDLISMVIGGPNVRKDFHLEDGEELFFQLKGDMCLRVIEQERFRDIPIKEGQIFLLPSHIPHSPQRFADTLGLVIERQRFQDADDGLLWFVPHDGSDAAREAEPPKVLYEEYFRCMDLGTQLGPVIERFFASEEYRTKCPTREPLAAPPIERNPHQQLGEPIDLDGWAKARGAGRHVLFDAGFQVTILQDAATHEPFCMAPGGELFLWQQSGNSTVHCADQGSPISLEAGTMELVDWTRGPVHLSQTDGGRVCVVTNHETAAVRLERRGETA